MAANLPVKSKTAIVTGDPGSPMAYGRKRYYTCTYDHTATATNTLSGIGSLKSGDQVQVYTLKTDTGTGYAGICWNTANTVYDTAAGVVGLAPVNAAPAADMTLLVIIEEL